MLMITSWATNWLDKTVGRGSPGQVPPLVRPIFVGDWLLGGELRPQTTAVHLARHIRPSVYYLRSLHVCGRPQQTRYNPIVTAARKIQQSFQELHRSFGQTRYRMEHTHYHTKVDIFLTPEMLADTGA